MNSTQTAPGSDDLAWFKSSYSTEQGGACLEVATSPATVHVRDSKNPEGPVLTLPPTSWAAFTVYATTTLRG